MVKLASAEQQTPPLMQVKEEFDAEAAAQEMVADAEEINERHRHRYEFNNAYREQLEAAGLVFSGLSPDGNLVEAVEIPDHPWFFASQFHPEFKSRPLDPHPLFKSFIRAAIEYKTRAPGHQPLLLNTVAAGKSS